VAPVIEAMRAVQKANAGTRVYITLQGETGALPLALMVMAVVVAGGAAAAAAGGHVVAGPCALVRPCARPAAAGCPTPAFAPPFLKGMSVFKYTSSWVKVTRMAKSQVSGIPEAQVTATYESDTKVGDLRPGLWWGWW
jgi:hypothetical protein